MGLGVINTYQIDMCSIKYCIYIHCYGFVCPIGIHIFPIGYSLFPVGYWIFPRAIPPSLIPSWAEEAEDRALQRAEALFAPQLASMAQRLEALIR